MTRTSDRRLLSFARLVSSSLLVCALATSGCTTGNGDGNPEVDAGPDIEEDAGSPEVVVPLVGDTCDPFTFTNVCGVDAPWEKLTCEAGVNQVVAEDCREAIDINALTTCGEVPCLDDDGESCDDYRVACLQPQDGGTCAVRNRFTDGTPCAGNLGCIFTFDNGNVSEVCRPTTSCEIDAENGPCVGNIATWCVYDLDRTITWETAQGVDCASFGGTCAAHDDLGSVCRLAEGTPCNDIDATSVFHCADGLVCEGASAVAGGVCQPEP